MVETTGEVTVVGEVGTAEGVGVVMEGGEEDTVGVGGRVTRTTRMGEGESMRDTSDIVMQLVWTLF